jgi:hypothetical protein
VNTLPESVTHMPGGKESSQPVTRTTGNSTQEVVMLAKTTKAIAIVEIEPVGAA